MNLSGGDMNTSDIVFIQDNYFAERLRASVVWLRS